MHDLKIPGCAFRTRRGDAWPRHKAKARNKRSERRRVIAALPKENTCGFSYSQ